MASPGHSYDWTHWKWKQGTLLKERTVTFPFPFSIHLSLRIFGFHYRLNWTGFVILLYQLGKKLHRLRAEKLILRTMSLRYGKSMLVHISKSIICFICLLTSVLLAYPPGYFWHIWSLWTIACYCIVLWSFKIMIFLGCVLCNGKALTIQCLYGVPVGKH